MLLYCILLHKNGEINIKQKTYIKNKNIFYHWALCVLKQEADSESCMENSRQLIL